LGKRLSAAPKNKETKETATKMKIFFVFAIFSAILIAIEGSSHSEAPGSSNLPGTDITDFYAFQSYEPGRSGYTTFIANFNPRHPPFGGPNYYALDPNFFYHIYIDNTGDGFADIGFAWQFTNELAAAGGVNPPPFFGHGKFIQKGGRGLTVTVGKHQNVYVALKAIGPITAGNNAALNFLEYYRIVVVNAGSASGLITNAATGSNTFQKPFDNAGTKTFPSYSTYAAQYIYNINIPGCATTGRVFTGQRAESFSINLGKIFDLINFIPINGAGTGAFPNGVVNDPSNNVIRWLNIVSLIIEVPTTCITGSGNGVIGAYGGATNIRGGQQKSRLGNPLVNELLIGLPDKDKWNRRAPIKDGPLNLFISYPTFPTIVSALFLQAVNSVLKQNFQTLAPTNYPRNDLVAVYLTGITGLNVLRDTPGFNGDFGWVEYMRLNTAIAPTAQSNQSFLGVLGNDNAGYPNGRRPGDDVIDITLRAAMGALCYLPKNPWCTASQAPVGNANFIDGAPISANSFANAFPYLNTPTPGSLNIN